MQNEMSRVSPVRRDTWQLYLHRRFPVSGSLGGLISFLDFVPFAAKYRGQRQLSRIPNTRIARSGSTEIWRPSGHAKRVNDVEAPPPLRRPLHSSLGGSRTRIASRSRELLLNITRN